jgi:transposase
LGIAEKMLYRWRSEQLHEGADAFRGNGRRTAEEDELVRLRRENAELKMERDILKKAAAWFAKQQL